MFFNPNRKVLTGVIPGVEIGCIVEYCYEYEEYNPEDPRLFSPGFFFQSTEPMILSRLTVEMPKDVPLNYATRNFPEPKQADPAIEETGDTRIYIAGDTEDIPEMKQIKNIDIAFLPVNQPYTMIPEQAIQSAKIIQPHILYPYHYGDTNINEVKDGLKNEKEIEVRIRALQ